jgi:hypothetical protein
MQRLAGCGFLQKNLSGNGRQNREQKNGVGCCFVHVRVKLLLITS